VRTVVIVDDSAAFRRQIRTLLTREGFDVVGEAATGATALVACRELRPDLILLDIGLPDVDGFDLAEQLMHETTGDPEERVVVLTSSREAATYRARLRRTAATGFIPKDELSGQAIDALLAARSA
jgi:DNA-binding NarL/FixJ family response regulator